MKYKYYLRDTTSPRKLEKLDLALCYLGILPPQLCTFLPFYMLLLHDAQPALPRELFSTYAILVLDRTVTPAAVLPLLDAIVTVIFDFLTHAFRLSSIVFALVSVSTNKSVLFTLTH
jgi:hypothetical protein